MGHRIVRDIERPDPDVLAGFDGRGPIAFCSKFGLGEEVLLDGAIRPLQDGMRAFGPALTVEIDEPDLLMPMAALKLAQPGDVLVVKVRSERRSSIFGSMMALSALNMGVGAAVIDGFVCNEIMPEGFGLFARSTTPVWDGWTKPGSINVPIECGGVPVEPGDLVVGDRNGVIVVPKSRLAEAKQGYDAFLAMFRDHDFASIPTTPGPTWYDVMEIQKELERHRIPGAEPPA